MQTNSIALTDEQLKSLEGRGRRPLRMVNPHTSEAFVLLSEKEFERLRTGDYDDEPLSRKELEEVAWAVTGEEEWPEYESDSNAS